MNEDINGAIDLLLDLGRRTGRISRAEFDRACVEFDLDPTLLSHWFQKRFNVAWEDYRLESRREQQARAEEEAKMMAKTRFDRQGDRFRQHLAVLNGQRSTRRAESAFYFIGLLNTGFHYEIVGVGSNKISKVSFKQIKKSAPDLARQILQANTEAAKSIARERVANDPERYRYGVDKAGLIDGRGKWCYVAMRHDDMHELISLEDFASESLEWSDIYEISYSFVRDIQS